MTKDDVVRAPLQLAAQELLDRVDRLAELTVARTLAEVPAYRELPASALEGSLVANILALARLFLGSLADDREITDAELAGAVQWGAERAHDGLPLDAVLAVYPLGARVTWSFAQSLPIEVPAEFALRMFSLLERVVPWVANAYLRTREDIDFERRERRQALASALLSGRAADRAASRFDRTLADRYVVIVFDTAGNAQRNGPRAAIELMRRVRDELDAEPDVLATFRDTDGVLLVPCSDRDVDTDRAAALIARLQSTSDGRTIAARSGVTDRADLPEAHAQASELRHLAVQLGRPPGLYTLDDLALDFQIAQPGPAREALAAKLDPVRAHPHLLDALRALSTHAYRRTEAARSLTIHRNTLVYRLSRIHALTGLDPTDPAQAHTLAAALTALDLTHRDDDAYPRP